jgi:hypothetical protein
MGEGGDHGFGAVCGDGWEAKEWRQKNQRTILLPPFFCLRFPARLIHEGSIQGGIDRRMGTREEGFKSRVGCSHHSSVLILLSIHSH